MDEKKQNIITKGTNPTNQDKEVSLINKIKKGAIKNCTKVATII